MKQERKSWATQFFYFIRKMLSRIANSVKCNYNCDCKVCVCMRPSMFMCVLLCLTVSCMPQYLLIPVVHMCMHTCACMQTPIAIAHYSQGKRPVTNILLKLKMTFPICTISPGHLRYHLNTTISV